MVFHQCGFFHEFSCKKEVKVVFVLVEHWDLCFLRFCEEVNDLSHVEQLNGLSLVCTLWCIFKLSDLEHL